MRSAAHIGALSVITCLVSFPAAAQERSGLMADLIKDVDQVQKKIVGLANAMPEPTYGWRPVKEVRSTKEVLMHVAADNYFMPAVVGANVPADTGINAKSYETAVAFEKRALPRDQVIAQVEKSFALLKTTMTGFPDAKLEMPVEVFGEKTTNRELWISTVTHLHEHLGQLIAYARSNSITPPWSK